MEAIDKELAPGASLAQIKAFAAADSAELGLEAVGGFSAGEYDSTLIEEHGLAPDTPVYVAVIKEKTRNLYVVFVLDEQQRLQDIVIYEVGDSIRSYPYLPEWRLG